MERFVALLRGINVGGRALVPMADLRELAEALGWKAARTYIQSGNLLFQAAGEAAAHEAALKGALNERLGTAYPVIVRTADEWSRLAATTPFPDAAATEPNRLMLLLSQQPPAPGAAEAIQDRARDGERIAAVTGGLWVHYAGGSGTSKLSPSLIDRLVGSATTSRNYRTVQKLAAILAGAEHRD